MRLSPGLVLGDGEDLLLCRLQKLLRGEEVGVTFADDLGGALDQLAADRFLADELGVIPGVGRVGHAIGDLEEHLVAADLLELIAAGQLVGQRHGVHALAGTVQLADCAIDDLVRVPVKIVGSQELGDLMENFVVQQDSAQQPAFGLEVLWRQVVGEGAAAAPENGALPLPPPPPLPLPKPGG